MAAPQSSRRLRDQAIGRLYEVATPSADNEISFDIVFLHGLCGSWDETWTSANTAFFWPRDILAIKYPSSRILSYDCPQLLSLLEERPADVDGLISEIIFHRSTSGRSYRPLVLIGHSFGGNLLKQLFNATHPSRCARDEYRLLHSCIKGYVFLGVPHHRFLHPDPGDLFLSLEEGSHRYFDGDANSMRSVFTSVLEINDEFRQLGGEDLPSICFHEGIKTWLGIKEEYIVSKFDASLRPGINVAHRLELQHKDLGRFSGPDDPNWRRIIAPFAGLLQCAEAYSSRDAASVMTVDLLAQSQPQQLGLRILSFDGGGVRGLFSVIILERLLAEVRKLHRYDSGLGLPHDYFDLIGGTSTGGLLAMMLGRLRMDIRSCKSAYRNISLQVFDHRPSPFVKAARAAQSEPFFSASRLETAVRQIVKDFISVEERDALEVAGTPVRDAPLIASEPRSPKCFVCAICSGHHTAERIRSYHPLDPSQNAVDTATNFTIWQAARATSAAPCYFAPIQIGGHSYFDGGLDVNNPIAEVVREARAEFPGRNIDVIVSIGTGDSPLINPTPPISNTIQSLMQRMTSTETHHVRFQRENPNLRAQYFRFQQHETMLGQIDLADSASIDVVERLADDYLRSNEVRRSLVECAAKFVRP